MTFHGPRASESAHEDDHAHAHAAHDVHDDHAHDDHGHGHDHTPHESPPVMLVPLGLLSLGAIFSGVYFYNYFVDHSNEAFWAGAIYRASENHVLHARHEVPEWVIYAPLIVTLGGFVLATMTYFFNRGVGKRIADSGGPLYSLFYNKWYFDEIYNATLVRGAAFLGNIFWKADKKVIDGVGADGMTALTLFNARRLSAMHTGRLYHYAFIIIGAALVFGALMWLNAGGAH
jgi:NADH-quinone oxidoreductase subunit L